RYADPLPVDDANDVDPTGRVSRLSLRNDADSSCVSCAVIVRHRLADVRDHSVAPRVTVREARALQSSWTLAWQARPTRRGIRTAGFLRCTGIHGCERAAPPLDGTATPPEPVGSPRVMYWQTGAPPLGLQ